MNRKVLVFALLAISIPLVFAEIIVNNPGGGGTGASGAAGAGVNASTNSFTTVNGSNLFSKVLLNSRNEFWDDFDGQATNAIGFRLRRSPSGHLYGMNSATTVGTNSFRMEGGKWIQTNEVSDPVYIAVTNTGARAWNRIGGIFRYKTNTFSLAPPYSLAGIINFERLTFGSGSFDYLHSYADVAGQITVQKSLGEIILQDLTGDNGFHARDRIFYEITFFTNWVMVEVNGYKTMAYHTNLSFMSAVKCPMWEINGSSTNTAHVEWESIWAGYSDVAEETIFNGGPFPEMIHLYGATNLVIPPAVRRSYYMATNANHGLSLTNLTPGRGQEVTITHTNSAATNYTVTFYTNSVAASFYSLEDKTNATSWTVPAGSIVSSSLEWTGYQWLRKDVEAPLATLAVAGIVVLMTNGTTIIITNTTSTGSGSVVLSNTPSITDLQLNGANISGLWSYLLSVGVTGVGGANTNFTFQASGTTTRHITYVDAGTTNVNIVAIMGGLSSSSQRGTFIFTNRTATSRIVSLSATTNKWISLQKYDGLEAPITVTNGLGVRMEWELYNTNVYYAFKPHDLPGQ